MTAASSHILPTGAKNKPIRCPHATIITAVFPAAGQLTRKQWQQLLAKADGGNLPPEAHAMLVNASHHLEQKRYRSAVLDAATAAEIALTELQDRSLPKSLTGDKKRKMQVKFRQFDGLLDSLALMDIARPEHIRDKVGDPRNDTIHQGTEPSESSARECIAKADEVVEQVYPKSSLLSN